MVKFFSKLLVVFGMVCLIFTLFVSKENNTKAPLKILVANIKKGIVPPVNNPRRFSDIQIDMTFENISSHKVEFDQIKAVFLHRNKPISASTYNMEQTKFDQAIALSGYYSDGIRNNPPDVTPGLLITIEQGEQKTFQLQTANSRYGSLNPLFKRELILNLYRNNELAYGPYKIPLKL